MQQFNGQGSQNGLHAKGHIDTNYLQVYAKQNDLSSSRKAEYMVSSATPTKKKDQLYFSSLLQQQKGVSDEQLSPGLSLSQIKVQPQYQQPIQQTQYQQPVQQTQYQQSIQQTQYQQPTQQQLAAQYKLQQQARQSQYQQVVVQQSSPAQSMVQVSPKGRLVSKSPITRVLSPRRQPTTPVKMNTSYVPVSPIKMTPAQSYVVANQKMTSPKKKDSLAERKINLQAFASNLMGKLYEFHQKLVPLQVEPYLSIERVNQYDIVVDDLNQEIAHKNEKIAALLEQTLLHQKETQQLKEALHTQGKQVQFLRQPAPSSIPSNEISKQFQKEVQCLQGFLEIKLITFMEQLFCDLSRHLREHGIRLKELEAWKQQTLQQLLDLQNERSIWLKEGKGLREQALHLQTENKNIIVQLQQRDQQIENLKSRPAEVETIKETVVDSSKVVELEDIIYQQRIQMQEIERQLRAALEPREPEIREVEIVKTVEVEDTQRIDSLNDHIIMLHAELDGLKKTLQEKESYTEIQVNNYQIKIAEYEKRLAMVQSDYNTQQEVHSSTLREKEEQVADLQAELDKQNDVVAQYKQEIEEYIEEISEMEDKLQVNDDAKWLSKISLLEQEIDELKLKLKDADIDRGQAKMEQNELRGIVDSKSQQLYSLQNQISNLNNEGLTAQAQIAESRKSVADLQSLNVSQKKDFLRIKQDKEEVLDQLHALENKIRAKDREIDDLRAEIQSLEDSSRHKTTDDGTHLLQLQKLQTQLQHKQTELDSCHDQVQSKEREINSLNFDVRQQKEYITSLEAQLQKNRADMENKLNQLDDTKKQYEQAAQSGTTERRSIMRKSLMQSAKAFNF